MVAFPDPGKELTLPEVLNALSVDEGTLDRMIANGQFSRPKRRSQNGVRFWFEADIIVYRYRLMRGDFDDQPDEGGETGGKRRGNAG